jgi:predicted small secreted protein
MKRILQISAWLLVLGSMAFIAACNTVEGAGKDVSSAGNAISDTASDVKHDMD